MMISECGCGISGWRRCGWRARNTPPAVLLVTAFTDIRDAVAACGTAR